jgi:hypothetical protein
MLLISARSVPKVVRSHQDDDEWIESSVVEVNGDVEQISDLIENGSECNDECIKYTYSSDFSLGNFFFFCKYCCSTPNFVDSFN